MRKILFVAGVAALGLTSPAEAACQISPFRFSPGSDTDAAMNITDGSRCNITVRAAGRTTFNSSRISSPPANGMARTNGTSGAAYQPKAGFKGSDAFTFTVCYTTSGAPGCSNVRVRVTVQ